MAHELQTQRRYPLVSDGRRRECNVANGLN